MNDFDKLRGLLESNIWPVAVASQLICNPTDERDKLCRAESILSWIVHKDLTGQKFLDFGCGEGHVVQRSIEEGAINPVGYDIDKTNWDRLNGRNDLLLTNNWEEVAKRGPYDVVLAYDVFDHLVNCSPLETLRKIKQVMNPEGVLFCRMHPWCSRHATHVYRTMNKAYVHLVFTEEEMKQLHLEETPVCDKIIHPIRTYEDHWIRPSGFRIKDKFMETKSIEKFFIEEPLVTERIRSHWKQRSHIKQLQNGDFPEDQLKQQFIDYTLTL